MVARDHKPSSLPVTSASAAGPQPHVETADGKVTATLPDKSSVTILQHGATVISWTTASGAENLFLSSAAALDGSKPVRGGIPVVFPVFGPPPADHATSALPQHGFARTSRWEYLGSSASESSGIKLDFGLDASTLPAAARAQWPHAFGLQYSVTLTPGAQLRTMLTVRNTGSAPWECQMLLHTYFRVPAIAQTRVAGLLGAAYVDKVLGATRHDETHAALPITGEVDRVYAGLAQDTTSIVDADGKTLFDVQRDNLRDTVVWNPWIEKAKAMGDFKPDDGYKNMLCVEVGAVDGWQRLEAGETFEAGQLITSHL